MKISWPDTADDIFGTLWMPKTSSRFVTRSFLRKGREAEAGQKFAAGRRNLNEDSLVRRGRLHFRHPHAS
jgi:hypothetical protein